MFRPHTLLPWSICLISFAQNKNKTCTGHMARTTADQMQLWTPRPSAQPKSGVLNVLPVDIFYIMTISRCSTSLTTVLRAVIWSTFQHSLRSAWWRIKCNIYQLKNIFWKDDCLHFSVTFISLEATRNRYSVYTYCSKPVWLHMSKKLSEMNIRLIYENMTQWNTV